MYEKCNIFTNKGGGVRRLRPMLDPPLSLKVILECNHLKIEYMNQFIMYALCSVSYMSSYTAMLKDNPFTIKHHVLN